MFDKESTQTPQQLTFLEDVEHAIRDANRKIIHAQIPHLDRARFVGFATYVAHLRADYLSAGLGLVDHKDGATFEALRLRCKAFEEAKAVFAALERAIECGYVDIA